MSSENTESIKLPISIFGDDGITEIVINFSYPKDRGMYLIKALDQIAESLSGQEVANKMLDALLSSDDKSFIDFLKNSI
jgi:hypothetical protein